MVAVPAALHVAGVVVTVGANGRATPVTKVTLFTLFAHEVPATPGCA